MQQHLLQLWLQLAGLFGSSQVGRAVTEVSNEPYIDEVKAIFNHICLLHDTDLVRCIGFSTDALDYYYIVKDLRGKVYHSTFVGPCVSLKGTYSRYDILENLFTINGSPPEEEFRVETASDKHNWKLYRIKTINGVEDEAWMNKYYELRNALEEHMEESYEPSNLDNL